MAAALIINVTWVEDGRVMKFQFDVNEHPTFSTLLGVVGPAMLKLKGTRAIFSDMSAPLESLPVKDFSATNWTQPHIQKNLGVFKEQVKEIILNIDYRLSKLRPEDPDCVSLRLMQNDLRRILQ